MLILQRTVREGENIKITLTSCRKDWAEFYGYNKQVSNDQSLQGQSVKNLSNSKLREAGWGLREAGSINEVTSQRLLMMS